MSLAMDVRVDRKFDVLQRDGVGSSAWAMLRIIVALLRRACTLEILRYVRSVCKNDVCNSSAFLFA